MSGPACKQCGGALVWIDEVYVGQGTGYLIQVCEECGLATGERARVGT